MAEERLHVNVPPTRVVNITQSRTVGDGFHLTFRELLPSANLIHDFVFFEQRILIFYQLDVVSILLMLTGDVANTPQLLAELFIIFLELHLLGTGATMILPIELEPLEA